MADTHLGASRPQSFADEIPDGKKTNIEWEQLLRARFEPTDTTEGAQPEPCPEVADPVATADDSGPDSDLESNYLDPSRVPAGMVSIGDLLDLDDATHGWVTVTDLVRDDANAGHSEVQLEWRDDNGEVGDLIIGRGELLEIRRPR